jgi:tRNA threonylcarbamoyladenosine biosynthesis protein TsaE
MVTNISHSPSDTFVLGETWGKVVVAGQIIGLRGDLGAGKTQLVKGLARGLGIQERVHSPTFGLVNIYNGGRLTLFHLDLYRLDSREQIIGAGLEEYLRPNGVTVIEWAERWFGALPDVSAAGFSAVGRPLRWVQIDIVSEAQRSISYEDIGA